MGHAIANFGADPKDESEHHTRRGFLGCRSSQPKPPVFEGARSKALDQDVGVGREPTEMLGVLALAQIEGDGLGAAEEGGETDPDPTDLRRHHPHRVAGRRALRP